MASNAKRYHHAVCLHVPEVDQTDFLRASSQRTLPSWKALADAGIVESRVVFKTVANVQEDTLPAWRFLALTRLGDGITPTDFLSETVKHAGAFEEPHARVQRAEFLTPNDNAYYPASDSTAAVYSIEYIRVFHDYLDTYRNMMEAQTGPAVGALVKDGYAHSFLAFDTESVLQSSKGLPDWTAIHVLGLDSTTRWEGFPEAIDPHLRAFDEASGFDEVFGALPQIRTMERHVFANRIDALSIGY